jgi:hypothetical protein
MRCISAKATMFVMGGIFGGLGSYLWVNGVLEHRTSNDILNLHRNASFYVIDALGVVACSAVGYCLGAWCDQIQSRRPLLNEDLFRENNEDQQGHKDFFTRQ